MSLLSIWRDRPDAVAADLAVVPEVGGEWDSVVVGAGITGLTTALLLARSGRSVLVLEGRQVGAGTTGGSTAKLSLLQGTQLSRIAARQPTTLLRQYVEANLEAQAWVTEFCAVHDVGLQHRSAYTYATTARGEAAARREHEHAREAGLPVEWLDDVPLPFPVRGALHLPDQRQLDPMELLHALAGSAVEHGAVIVEGARVTGVHGHTPASVVTAGGTAHTSHVVVATGVPVLDRGGYFARVTPARSYGLAYRTDLPVVDAMYLSTDSMSRSLRDAPAASGSILLVGGNGHTPGRTASPQARIEQLRAWTHEHFRDVEETHAWSAQDYVPHHGLPYAGPLLPGREDIVFAGGFAKWGMTNGVAAALALTAEALGSRPGWADAYRTWSPRELTGLPTASRANAEVGLEMASGWVRALRPGTAAPGEGQGTTRLDRASPVPTAMSTDGGTTRRVSAVCTHLGGIVRWNDAERSWDCPLHGSRFGPDGRVLEGVATCGLAPRNPAPPSDPT